MGSRTISGEPEIGLRTSTGAKWHPAPNAWHSVLEKYLGNPTLVEMPFLAQVLGSL